MKTSALVLAGLLVFEAGCNLQVRTGGRGGKGSSGGGGAGHSNSPEDEQKVRDYFANFHHDQGPEIAAAGTGWYFATNMKLKPLFHPYEIDAPDPQWIPGWESVQAMKRDDVAWEALAQAAANRTWTKACRADFQDWSNRWNAIIANVPELTAPRDANPYLNIIQLRDARKKVLELAIAEKLLVPHKHPYRFVGPYFNTTFALAETLRATKREFLLGEMLGNREDLERFAKFGHTLGEGNDERDRFCIASMPHGTHKTIPLPTLANNDVARKAVKWPVDSARKKALAAADAKDRPAVQAMLAVPTVKKASIHNDEKSPPEDPKLAIAEEFTVTGVYPGRIDLTRKVDGSYSYDCVSTNKVEKIQPDGKVIYFQNCKSGATQRHYVVHVNLVDMPPGFTLQNGDVVWAYVDVESKKELMMSNTPNFHATRYDLDAKLRHLSSVKRAGKELATWRVSV